MFRMKNPEKLAASKKTPIQGKYYHGTVVFGRFTEDELRQLNDISLEKDVVVTIQTISTITPLITNHQDPVKLYSVVNVMWM